MTRHTRRLLLLGALLLAAGATAAARKGTQTPDAGQGHLSAVARETLQGKMKNHSVDMQRLLDAVLRLDRDKAQSIARQIAEDDRLARPLEGDPSLLNSAIPPRFYDLQDELRASARDVAEAAEHRHDEALAKSFGKLTETCVACHALYFHSN